MSLPSDVPAARPLPGSHEPGAAAARQPVAADQDPGLDPDPKQVSVSDSPSSAAGGASDPPADRPRSGRAGGILGRILIALASVAAIVLLRRQLDLADLWDQLREADPLWLGVAALAAVLPVIGSAAGFVALAPGRLPFGRTTLVQLATSFFNLITPASAGGLALNVRFLSRQGIPLAVAVAVVGLVQTTSVLVTAVLVVVLLLASGRSLSDAPHLPWMTVLVATLLVVAVAAVLRLWPRGRELAARYLLRPFREAGPQLWGIVTDRRRMALAVLGHLCVTFGFVAILAAALAAVGQSAPLVLMAVVVIGGSAIAGAVPVPGGIGAAEAALFSGLVVIGVESAPALSAALIFRMLTFWLRVPIGWLALIALRRGNAV